MTETFAQRSRAPGTIRPMDDQRSNRSGVMGIIAMVTFFQGLCFYGVSYLDKSVAILPKDPITLIAIMYVVMGLLFMLISCHMSARGKNCACGNFWVGCRRPARDPTGNVTADSGSDGGKMQKEAETKKDKDSTEHSDEFERIDADTKKVQ